MPIEQLDIPTSSSPDVADKTTSSQQSRSQTTSGKSAHRKSKRSKKNTEASPTSGEVSPLVRSVMARRNKKKVVLIVYLFFIFCMTHIDLNGLGLGHINFRSANLIIVDKLFHFSAYAMLAFIVLFTATGKITLDRGRIRLTSAKRVIVWSFIVLLYAFADEITQPMFNRSFEIGDLIADAIGISVGQTVFVVCEAFGLRKMIERLR